MGFSELEQQGRERRQAERDERERRRVFLERIDTPAAAMLGAALVAVTCLIVAYAGWRVGFKGSPLIALLGLLLIVVARWRAS